MRDSIEIVSAPVVGFCCLLAIAGWFGWLFKIGAPVLAEALAVVLFIGMVAVFAALGCGA